MSAILEFKSVWKALGKGAGKQSVLENVSLTLNPGDIAVVIGPSGSGKTTLLTLAGLLDRPDKGEIWLDGKCVSKIKPQSMAWFRRHELGFIFQGFNLMPVLTALENVELALYGLEPNAPLRRSRALEALERVGIGAFKNRLPGEMSGGQQQRVGIARSLIRGPKLMLADEPTANLDSRTRDDVISLLRNIAERDGQTVLISTHDTSVAAIANRIFKLDKGVLKEETV